MRWHAFKFLLPILVYAGSWFSFHQTGWLVFSPLLLGFVLIPFLELFMPSDASNMSEAEEAIAKNDPLYDGFLYIIVPLQFMALYWFLSSISENLAWWELAGRIASMGLLCGTFGINVGHELGHRQKKYEQWMAKALLLTSMYTHFFIEHNKGHHKHVSTPQDPSSAPLGMSLYAFWWRSVIGTWLGAWQIANDDLRKKGLPSFSWRNEMLQLQILQVAFVVVIGLMFGWIACGYFLIAAIIGFLLLETVNYIEHYGLSRRQIAPGKYERALPQHSWNSNHVLGRMVLFELSRHSDHHYLASRKYQILRHHDDAPQLPTGYPGSMILATIPPLWFKVMNERIKQVKSIDKSP